MPDGRRPIDFDEAVAEVEDWLRSATGDIARLPSDAEIGKRGRPAVAGWRVTLPCGTGARRVDIRIDAAFPFSAPRLTLVDRPPYLTWPHVEQDGRLCLATETVTYSPYDPVGTLANLIHAAFNLIERCENGETDEDFRSEVLSYWTSEADYRGPTVYGINDPDGPSRMIRVWWGQGFALLGDSDNDVKDWLKNRFGPPNKRNGKTAAGVFLRLEKPLAPAEYPRTAEDLFFMARDLGAVDLMAKALTSIPEKLAVVLAMPTEHGTAIVGTIVRRPIPRRGVDTILKGFGAGRPIPFRILVPRFYTKDPVEKARVERVDAGWIHGRCQDPRFSALRDAKVVVFGCGSVGAPVAVALAQAGVGHLLLVDYDLLEGANLGRHPLGMRSLRTKKAEALKRKIAADLPHVRVDALSSKAEAVIFGPASRLADTALIVSAMGNWASERLLDEWHEADDRVVPVLYAWTEPRAAAGHALTVVGPGSSLQRGLDDTGVPLLRVTDWEGTTTKRQEPACGAMYEPYGPVELGYINAMTTELALDALLGNVVSPTHRIWACSRAYLDRVGGRWTREWEAQPGFRAEGGFITNRACGDAGSRLRAA